MSDPRRTRPSYLRPLHLHSQVRHSPHPSWWFSQFSSHRFPGRKALLVLVCTFFLSVLHCRHFCIDGEATSTTLAVSSDLCEKIVAAFEAEVAEVPKDSKNSSRKLAPQVFPLLDGGRHHHHHHRNETQTTCLSLLKQYEFWTMQYLKVFNISKYYGKRYYKGKF